MNERNFEICPYCNTDLTNGDLMYVEEGCSNYLYYKKDAKLGWIENDELNGDNPSETYYACRQCGQQLPVAYQDYFGDNV